jgi:hypothetical protein
MVALDGFMVLAPVVHGDVNVTVDPRWPGRGRAAFGRHSGGIRDACPMALSLTGPERFKL